jgi:hypothetical protein
VLHFESNVAELRVFGYFSSFNGIPVIFRKLNLSSAQSANINFPLVDEKDAMVWVGGNNALKGQSHQILGYMLGSKKLNKYFWQYRLWF